MGPRLAWGESSPARYLLEDRPEAVSDAGLLSVVLGVPDQCIRDVVMEICPTPDMLWQVRAPDLISLPGVGPAKAARLLACLEISRRTGMWKSPAKPVISTPKDVFDLCWPQLMGSDRERFWTLALSTKNHLLKTLEVSVGSLNVSIVHPRELFKDALRVSAASIVVVHNHPSGDPTPSGADIQLTKRLVSAGDLIGIELLDHVVIGNGGNYTSLKDLGLM